MLIPKKQLPLVTLMLLISFASVNAVLFTPALPDIVSYFTITADTAQLTVMWFLIGYAIGQLVYGPIANRFGRKLALYAGISLQILSSFLCILSGVIHSYSLLVISRFLLALGSGVGLKMTFTLVNEYYDAQTASQKTAYLMLAFAITPALAVAVGGVLNAHYGWMSCFYASALYGIILLALTTKLPETKTQLDVDALKIKQLMKGYGKQFKNMKLINGGLLMGGCTAFVYIFAALAPFLAINLLGMTSSEYGVANLLPAIGLILGSVSSAKLIKTYSFNTLIRVGVVFMMIGTICMATAVFLHLSALFSLFLPMIIIYYGSCFILANASTIAMQNVSDKAHGSAVINFINMSFATLLVLSLGFVPVHQFLLPGIYLIISGFILVLALSS